MSDFTAIGQLVTEARNLLDSIKGGAIRAMETAFASLIANVNSEWAAKKSQVDNEALAAIGRVDTQTVIGDLGFTAYNFNGDFRDYVQLDPNKNGVVNSYPFKAGVGAGRNDGVISEVLTCTVGSNPLARAPAVRDLLDFIGIGADTLHFSGSFNIWKLTVVDPAVMGTGGVDFSLPDSHRKYSPSNTFMYYLRTEGDVSVSLGGNTAGVWDRSYSHVNSTSPGAYMNTDLYLTNAKAGDVVYFALPMMCVGKFPESIKHGSMVNLNTVLTRKINTNHPA
ncbi:Phage tail protein [Vibrio crassostreae]|uniref:phage tail protein n=1 Tax=Vibrio crassostreae TaxID=246167 RepID=UPI001B313E4A|nr:phage tail protein [Vibrio crassostreae]CAK1818069.1 Phage tail protein [Vibrio crassostreae]CAK1818153.1 Phage tail protein [Vibrio crassostreae]CAK1879816.1 Phage tail protein [Vibrio crassostreae]CAK1879928.1 Phage tail protein [Vibrio crassostreae]CAK1894045.1 Phage tail protein [Vibrio crassostreae]